MITQLSQLYLGKKSYVKSAKFSPDGSAIAVTTDEPVMNVWYTFDVSKPKISTKINCGDDISDFQFYPGFNTNIPQTQAVLVASRNRPIQLISSLSNSVISAYPAFSFTDEVVHPISLQFSPSCSTIAGSFPSSCVRIWDVQKPGRQIRDLIFSTRKQSNSFKGLISALTYFGEDILVAGSYGRQIRMFDIRDSGKGMNIGETMKFGGVVQLEAVDRLIISGHRMDKYLYVWDVRKPDEPVLELNRIVKNNQRFRFSLVGADKVASGDHYGDLTVFDLQTGDILLQHSVSDSRLVSVDVNGDKLVAGSGCRVWDRMEGDSEDEAIVIGKGSINVFSLSL